MNNLQFTTGYEPPKERASRWTKVYAEIEALQPGTWLRIDGLESRSDVNSLRLCILNKAKGWNAKALSAGKPQYKYAMHRQTVYDVMAYALWVRKETKNE